MVDEEIRERTRYLGLWLDTIEFTPEVVEAYAQITGDRNPLHFDADFVGRTRFEVLIAQGGIATGMLPPSWRWIWPDPGQCSSSRPGRS